MPTGKMESLDGPGAQPTLGRIQGTDGITYPFKNDAAPGELKEGDPVTFFLEQAEVTLPDSDTPQMTSVARLELDENGDPCITQSNWNVKMQGSGKKYKKHWDDEWDGEDENKIKKLKLKDGFKDPSDPEAFKKGLKKMKSIRDIRNINKKLAKINRE